MRTARLVRFRRATNRSLFAPMRKRLTRDADFKLAGFAAALVAILQLIGPAYAHERLWWHRALPYPYAERDPSDPNAAMSALRYRPVTRELRSYRPIDPLPWGDVNKRVTPSPNPAPKSEQKQ